MRPRGPAAQLRLAVSEGALAAFTRCLFEEDLVLGVYFKKDLVLGLSGRPLLGEAPLILIKVSTTRTTTYNPG
jgi:hypothetical protein